MTSSIIMFEVAHPNFIPAMLKAVEFGQISFINIQENI